MSLLALSLNHHSAPLDLRGRFAVPAERLAEQLGRLRQQFERQASGLALLSTCNRTEIYLHGEAPPTALLGGLAQLGGVSPEALQAHSQPLAGEAVARHAFRVAAGLDSAVLGEPQILGQLKQAVRAADGAGQLDSTLQQLFQRSFQVAKAVRTQTELGAHSVSLAAAALKLAEQLFGELHGRSLLLVGAGDMVERVAQHFAGRRPARIAVANRSRERGAQLAERLGAEALGLRGLDARLAEFDIVVSCTASSLPLIGLGAVQRALKLRRRQPMLMFDLAVPRDIEAEVGQLDDVYLYTVDDLAARAALGGERRQASLQQAEALVEQGVHGFAQWLAERGHRPLLERLQQRRQDWQQRELARARRRLAQGQPVDAVLAQLAEGLSAKWLHGTLAGLHRDADAGWAETVQRCFLAGR